MKQRISKWFKETKFQLAVAAALTLAVLMGWIDAAVASMGGALLMAKGIEAQGITVAISTIGSPESYTSIANVVNFKGPGGAASVIDVTNLSSLAKEKMMGLPDEGQFTLELNYDPDDATHQSIRSARAARTKVQIKVTFTDTAPATTAVFDCYVLGFEVSGAVDSVVKASVSMEIAGAVAWN